MTPLDLLYDIRLRANDMGGDTGTPGVGFTYYWEEDDAGCLVKNAELLRLLNRAHQELALRTSCYRDGATVEICQIAVTAGTANYAVDLRVLTIEDILLDTTGTPLVKMQLSDYRRLASHRTLTGTPTHYLEAHQPFQLTLYPVPSVDDVLYLTVYRYPLADMAWDERNVEVTEPPETLREALIQGTLMLYYQKHDADTGDVNLQKFHAQEFERLVGPPVDYRILENRRWNANLDMSLIPKGYVPRVKGTRRWYENELE